MVDDRLVTRVTHQFALVGIVELLGGVDGVVTGARTAVTVGAVTLVGWRDGGLDGRGRAGRLALRRVEPASDRDAREQQNDRTQDHHNRSEPKALVVHFL